MRPKICAGHTRPLTKVLYNADGDLIFSCSKDNIPTCWYSTTGERIGTYDGHNGTVWSLDVSKDSKFLITGGADMTCKLWNVSNGKCLCTFNMSGPCRVVSFAEGDKQFLTISDPFSGRLTTCKIFTLPDNLDLNTPFDESDCKFTEWQIPGLEEKKKLYSATWLPVNRGILTGDEFGVMRIHDITTGDVKREIKEHSNKINSMEWNTEKTLLVTGSSDHTSKLFDATTWRVLKEYETEVPVNSACISPIKEHVLVAGGQEAMKVTTTSSKVGKFETKFFHLIFGDVFGVVKGHFGPVNTLAIHPKGTGFVSGGEDGYIRIHDFDKSYYSYHSEFDDLEALLDA